MGYELDLLLINPGARSHVYGKLGNFLSGIEPPVWCGLIAGFIREKGYSVKIIDAEAENLSPQDTASKISEYNPRLAGIVVLGSNPSASSTPKMTAVGEVLTALKKKAPHIKTFLSGLHPSALPEKTLKEENVDFICQGEGFYTILQLLEVLAGNKEVTDYDINGLWYIKGDEVISNPPAPLVENLDDLPFVAWDLLPMDKYRAHNWHCFEHIEQRNRYAVIYTSLGCPFNCIYCNIHAMYNDKPSIRFRSPEKVVEEIDFLVKNYNIKNLKILDELFVLKTDRVMRICDLIIQRGYKLNIWVYARVDTVNEPLLKKMKQAGINWVAFGFESANSRVRKDVSKKFDQATVKKAIEMTQAAGINIIGNFIFGLPEDDLKTMRETLDMAKEFNFEFINFYTAMAYPGSKLYRDALKKGIKLPEQWHGYSQYGEESLPIPTKYISAAEVLRFRDNAFKEYLSNPKYLEMIRKKFGHDVEKYIKKIILDNIVKRKIKTFRPTLI